MYTYTDISNKIRESSKYANESLLVRIPPRAETKYYLSTHFNPWGTKWIMGRT